MQPLNIITVVIFLVIITIPFGTSLSFNFTNFAPNDPNIIYHLSASSSGGTLQLTPNTSYTLGRVTYAQTLHLWDRASGSLMDFSTNFSFIINSGETTYHADGLTFFLSASRIPPGTMTGGGFFALANDTQALNAADNPFIAVEFDIWSNVPWDPSYMHFGIDVNSIQSVVTAEWLSGDSIMEGRQHEAAISYDSASRNLSIILTGYRNGSSIRQILSSIVDFRQYLPEFVYFGFSGGTGDACASHVINSWDFRSTMQLYKNGTDSEAVAPAPQTYSAPVTPVFMNSSNKKPGLIIGLATGGPILAVVLGLSMYFIWKRRKGRSGEDDEFATVSLANEFERGSGPKKFAYNELARATNNFSEREKLGEGGFGGVYKGFLREIDSYVAIKKVSRGSHQGVKEYASEVKIISRLRHRNLVQLLGWCHDKKELLLVYEFMPNASLDHHLFKGKSLLDWPTRFKIVQGLASALLYLHDEWEQCVVHRDIKSSNVMLDANFNTKLGDFGLARLVDHEKESQTTVVAGTMGYMAPECAEMGKSSKESDVFSFGVVALEVACGRRPIDPSAEESRANMVEWVWNLYGMGNILDAADPLLINTQFEEREMEQLMIVGLWCTHPDSNQRPSIRQALFVLNFEFPLPFLPTRRPVPSHFTPVTFLSNVSDNTGSYKDSMSSSGGSSALLHSK